MQQIRDGTEQNTKYNINRLSTKSNNYKKKKTIYIKLRAPRSGD